MKLILFLSLFISIVIASLANVDLKFRAQSQDFKGQRPEFSGSALAGNARPFPSRDEYQATYGSQFSGSRSEATFGRQYPVSKNKKDSQSSQYQDDSEEGADAEPLLYGGVQGTAGIDFPNYTNIPKTKFSCNNVPYEPAMYADEETQCQVYHFCFQGRKESFLCGTGTVFNQAILACDYWHSVECRNSKDFYMVNEELVGKASPETVSDSATQQWQQSQAQRTFQQPRASFRPITEQRSPYALRGEISGPSELRSLQEPEKTMSLLETGSQSSYEPGLVEQTEPRKKGSSKFVSEPQDYYGPQLHKGNSLGKPQIEYSPDEDLESRSLQMQLAGPRAETPNWPRPASAGLSASKNIRSDDSGEVSPVVPASVNDGFVKPKKPFGPVVRPFNKMSFLPQGKTQRLIPHQGLKFDDGLGQTKPQQAFEETQQKTNY